MDGLTLGQTAAFAGVTMKTVRHYHQHRLIDDHDATAPATAGTDRPTCCG